MKKFLLIAICAILIFVMACSVPAYEKDLMLSRIYKKINNSHDWDKLIVQYSPKMELIFALASMVETGRVFKYDNFNKVGNNVKEYFSAYSHHPAVTMLRRVKRYGFWNGILALNMLSYSDTPDLKQLFSNSTLVIHKIKNKENLAKFMDLLRDFARHSNFTGFFKENEKYYQELNQMVENIAREDELIKHMEEYYGITRDIYVINPTPLSNASFGNLFKIEDRQVPVATLGVPYGLNNSWIKYLILHEFGHTFIDEEKHLENVRRYYSLPRTLMGSARIYGNKRNQIYEEILRATTVRIVNKIYGAKTAEELKEWEINFNGFVYLEDFCEKLKEYEQNRDIYADFNDFIPELLKCYDPYLNGEKQVKQPNFRPTLFEVLYKDFVVFYGDGEEDKYKKKAYELQKYMKDRFDKEITVKHHSEYTEAELRNRNIILYGNMDNNKLIRLFRDSIPAKLKENNIELNGQIYRGTEFIYAFPNPYNDSGVVVVSTGADIYKNYDHEEKYIPPHNLLVLKDGKIVFWDYY